MKALPFSLGIAVGGLVLMNADRAGAIYGKNDPQMVMVRHDVTPEMQKAADALERTPLPSINEVDHEAHPVLSGDFKTGVPTVLVFVKNECPCSIEAQPFYNAMAKAFGGDVQFMAVIDSDPRDAAAYAEFTVTPYRVLADQDLSTIKALGAKASASAALIDGQGEVVKVWAGYSASVLRQINFLAGTLAKSGPVEFDQSGAPEKLTAGCTYEFPK